MTIDIQGEITALYRSILAGWNASDAEAFAGGFAEDGVVIGFDGSEVVGRARIAEQMAAIFADHATGTYVGIVREVTSLGPEAAPARRERGRSGRREGHRARAQCRPGAGRAASRGRMARGPLPEHPGAVPRSTRGGGGANRRAPRLDMTHS